MKTQRPKKKTRKLLSLMLSLAILFAGLNLSIQPAHAATGSVYTCSIVPSYRHPLTGSVEDSGGESSYATGQGMVDGCVYSTGMLEVTSDNKYYLTIRMSLMDYTSGHNFQVQTTGDSGWSKTVYGQTAAGSDSNGNTADICIQVPSEKCIIRTSMYVEPMGRDVIFYIYPNNFQAGNSTDMHATMVTSSADNQTGTSQNTSDNESNNTASTAQSASQDSGQTSQTNTQNSASADSSKAASSSLSTGNLTSGQGLTADASTDGTSADETATVPALGNNDMDSTQADAAQNSAEINSAEGLSLSTAVDTDSDGNDNNANASGNNTYTVGEQIAIRMIPPLVVGVVLIAAAAAVVYYFRKNWYRWGGGEDDDDDEE